MFARLSRPGICAAILAVLAGCNGAGGLLVKPSPHELYLAMLRESGLDRTALGHEWARASEQSLRTAVSVSTPFRETGYFPPEEATAIGYRMDLHRGRRLSVEVTFASSAPSQLFVDLFRIEGQEPPRRVAFLEPEQSSLVHEVERDGAYVLRIQPELLRGGRFTLVQRTLATLRFPISGLTTQMVRSLFGADRDAGARRHEGIDIFADRGTAVTAVVDGLARPGTNTLGGNVVWLHEAMAGRTFYYAHLDRWEIEGMSYVRAGDVLGYVGNTGNARHTPPHLHFGMYQRGAINPLPFLEPDEARPGPSAAPLDGLGELARVTARRVPVRAGPAADRTTVMVLERNALARVLGASAAWLRVTLPDDAIGYVPAESVTAADAPVRQERLDAASELHERPSESAPIVDVIERAARVDVLGSFGLYDLVRTPTGSTGWTQRRPARPPGAGSN